MSRFFFNVTAELCVVMALSTTGSARADEALPSQEEALARALVNHPDIVAAKAKVALADAELYGKRMEVSRQILSLYGTLKNITAQIEASTEALKQSKQAAGKLVAVDDKLAAEIRAAQAQLVQAIGQREQVEKELRLQIGTAIPAGESDSPNKAAAVARQVPQGPIVDKLKTAEEKPIKLDLVDMPLQDVMMYLSDKSGMMFSLQRPALEEAGIRDDEPKSLHTSEVRLHDALQAFEDANPGLQFVVRDYGVLLTTKDWVQEHGYVPVLELSKESGAARKSR